MRTLVEAQELRKRGYRVILGCQPKSFLERSAREQSIEVLPLRMNDFLSALVKLTYYLKREKVDLINAHGYPDHFLSAIARKITGIKAIVRTKHNHVPLKSGVFSRFLYGSLTSRIVTISEHIRDVMIQSGLPPSHITTISTAVDLDYFSPREKNLQLLKEFNLSPERTIIGIVSRLTERKGFTILFEAVKQMIDEGRSLTCLIVGGGASRQKINRLKNHAKSLGVTENILFTGRRSNIPEILSLIDVFVLPSLAEGLGRSLLEAMAAGRAIVAANVGGIPEAVENGKSGILVPPGNPRALAQAIAHLLDNPLQAQEMGTAARKRAELVFDQTTMIDRICSLYEELLTHAN